MLAKYFQNMVRGWSILWRPHGRIRELLGDGPFHLRLLLIFLGGILLVQLWADVFNLGDSLAIGKIMSVSLVLGPILGMILLFSGAFFVLLFGNWMAPQVRFDFERPWVNPPLPLRWLLWNRIWGYTKVNEVLDKGWLRPYKQVWSWLLGGFYWLGQHLASGPVSYGNLLTTLVRTFTPLLLGGILYWGELAYFDGVQMTTRPDVAPWLVVTGFLKGGMAIWSLLLWLPVLKEVYGLPLGKNVLLLALSLVSGLGLGLLFVYILGVPVWG